MSTGYANSITDSYLRAAGRTSDQRFRLAIEELAWLVGLSARLGGLRLELLRALQSALPRPDEQDVVTELKELLTNLIIMQTRLADRDGALNELMKRLVEGQILENVSVDEATLRDAIVGILEACAHVEAIGDNS